MPQDRPVAAPVGRRVVVIGVGGAGKSTFSRALAAETDLPVIHLDVHFWLPGWVAPPADEWREHVGSLLAGHAWIIDGNDLPTLDLRLERADTIVFLDTPRWLCVLRTLRRGVSTRPVEFQLPSGCQETPWRRLHDEWGLAWRIWRSHRAERERLLKVRSELKTNRPSHVVRSKSDIRDLLDEVRARDERR